MLGLRKLFESKATQENSNVVLAKKMAFKANLETNEGTTPLIAAVYLGDALAVQLLLEEGQNLETTTKDGFFALIIAAFKGYDKIAKLLLDKGAAFETKNKEGFNALMIAAMYNHIEIVQLLLDKNANLEAKDDCSGSTALILAADADHSKVVQLLLDRGAKLDATNNAGDTALTTAKKQGHLIIVKMLENFKTHLLETKNQEKRKLFLEGYTKRSEKLEKVVQQPQTQSPSNQLTR